MLFAVAAASLKLISLSLMKPCAIIPPTIVIRKKRPVRRASFRGDSICISRDYADGAEMARRLFIGNLRSVRTQAQALRQILSPSATPTTPRKQTPEVGPSRWDKDSGNLETVAA